MRSRDIFSRCMGFVWQLARLLSTRSRLTQSVFSLAAAFGLMLAASSAHAESLKQAMARAYQNNPSLEAERASVRSTDELIAMAKSALRPQINGFARGNKEYKFDLDQRIMTGSFGVEIKQTLFDGFKTRNTVRANEAAVRAARERLRNVEQDTLFDAASAYMDVIRDRKIATYRKRSLAFLNEQLRSERARFDVGEATRTDISQAQSSHAGAVAQKAAADGNLLSSEAVYIQVVGNKPGKLRTPKPPAKLIKRSLDQAISLAMDNHPAILAAQHFETQAGHDVETAKSDLLPSLSLSGDINRSYLRTLSNGKVSSSSQQNSGNIGGRLSIPIYQGGRVSADIRQKKELLGQRQFEHDKTVRQVRAAVISAFSQLQAAKARISANRSQLKAARQALDGAIEERKVGQRTTLDVLQSQQQVINAQISLAQAERDIVVASYGLLSATGKLSAKNLGLQVEHYEPEAHYEEVKDKWFGLRTVTGAQ